MVRNGHAPTRTVTTAAGPGGDDPVRGQRPPSGRTTGERCPFRSGIIPPWAGRRHQEPLVPEAPPLLYLHGMSANDFASGLEKSAGSAAGLSPSVVTRLTAQWQYEHHRFCRRNLAEVVYMYVWDDEPPWSGRPQSRGRMIARLHLTSTTGSLRAHDSAPHCLKTRDGGAFYKRWAKAGAGSIPWEQAALRRGQHRYRARTWENASVESLNCRVCSQLLGMEQGGLYGAGASCSSRSARA